MTVFNEVADGEGVLGGVSGDETFARHVEEVLDEVRDLLPLGRGWVNTGGVVSAGGKRMIATVGHPLIICRRSVNHW